MRLKSTATWLDLGGIEACYQPIGAPSAVDALMNVGRTDALGNHRMAGKYTATPGVLPTWSAARGWTFDGSQWLNTGVVDSASIGALGVSVSAVATVDNSTAIGTSYIQIKPMYYANTRFVYGSTGANHPPATTSGVLIVTRTDGYKNGIDVANTGGTTFLGRMLCLGAEGANAAGTSVGSYLTGNIRCAVLVSRNLTPAEVWLASRQMAYCDVNPDWNAWARRRRYYYAPSVAAAAVFNPAWARNTNTVINQVNL